ncbi:MAG: hypothetical protein M1817_003915 [Caeruleum heppii]|nr:MAG: hypothetical protein M1817_003915 [Caeruleum heppii]
MQKVLRRTALAKAQAAKKAKKRRNKDESIERAVLRQQHGVLRKQISRDIRTERTARREDVDYGSLAPRRDVGDAKETYGTMDTRRLKGPEIPREERLKLWTIVPGDRVVSIEGRDKGKIAEVRSIDGKRNEVEVQGLNLVDIAVPEWMLKDSEDPDKRPVRSIEAGIPVSSVRLVYPLPDPITGVKRDVIVKELAHTPVWIDPHLRTKRWARYIPGLNVMVPWPKKEPKKHENYDIDTLRIDVEQKTWVPTLLRPPMPMSVIDELRNKYSKFRDRHDEEYLAKKIAEDRSNRPDMEGLMITPLQEAKRLERKEKKTKGRPQLTSEMWSRIGEIMAKNRPESVVQGSARRKL